MDNENTMMTPEDGVEVVLTYTPDEPRPVVLTYEAQLPPAMCREQAEPDDGGSGGPRMRVASKDGGGRKKKKRRWVLWLILILAVSALLAAVGFGIYYIVEHTYILGPDDFGGHWEEPWDDSWDDSWMPGDRAEAETTIERYPVGGDARVQPLETHGEILTAQQVYDKVNPSVVSVVAYDNIGASVGTGVIMSGDGYVITNYHVVSGGEVCDVLTYSGLQYEAKLVGYDEENDLAVLKVEEEGLPAAEFGSSDLLTVGDKAYAIGNPLGLELRGTLTDGIISAINRDVDVQGTTMTLIQTNAALNSGNSGGPLINEYGQVVGINTIKMVAMYEGDATVEGLGFAIPSSTVAHIVNCLISTGEVTPQPVLGISVLGQALLPDGSHGVMVVEVTPGMGGELSGVRKGDIIVKSDGETVSESSDILRTRRRYDVGDNLPMTIYRDGEYLEVEVPLMLPLESE